VDAPAAVDGTVSNVPGFNETSAPPRPGAENPCVAKKFSDVTVLNRCSGSDVF